MPAADFPEEDTIRILIATDNHVGYNERDPIRGDDSWRSFDEIMRLAKDQDVDMVLLAGDLFHDNQPSRKAMFQVMRSLRENCYGEKPCELELLSDSSEIFTGAFNHVNYEDPDINVAIPVFSIHGNHDDPSGEGHFAALDLLQMSGLLNYYGRTPESDNIHIKPVLLQKGSTKLALYGMSNVRDERLFRTFRDGKVKFFQPNTAKDEWFNIMSVHQNHHAYTDTSYLPENFLPSFLDLVVWGHEHECKIDPIKNVETGFRVMQPGSSVATSLVPGESVAKHVAIVTVCGKDYRSESVRLKSVRPFLYKELVLADDEDTHEIAFKRKEENTPAITSWLTKKVDEMVEEARRSWLAEQDDDDDDVEIPLPLIRLRVECTPPEGGNYDVDNPQRFSRRFQGKVANTTDIVQFYKKRSAQRRIKGVAEMPEAATLAQMVTDTIKVGDFVHEFLEAQTLSILPQNLFSDAVGQFVNKDDKHAMEMFIKDSVDSQVKQLMAGNEDDFDEDKMEEQMEQIKTQMEQSFARGELKRSVKKGTRKPKPDDWDSEAEGQSWEDSLLSMVDESNKDANGDVQMVDDNDDDDEEDADVRDRSPTPKGRGTARGRGSRGGRGGKAAAGTARKAAATATKKAPANVTGGRGRKKVQESDEEDDNDVIMLDDDDDDESQGLFVSQASSTTARGSSTRAAPAATRKAAAPKANQATQKTAAASRQSTLSFGTQPKAAASKSGRARAEPSDDEISDDDNAFEPAPTASRRTGGRR